MEKVKELLENKSISRRSFLKGTAALGAMAAVYGCDREEDAISGKRRWSGVITSARIDLKAAGFGGQNRRNL